MKEPIAQAAAAATHPDPAASTAAFTSTMAKSILAWFGVLLGKSDYQWSDVAAFAAAVYTLLLILSWFWDRLLSPLMARFFPNHTPRSRNGRSKAR